MKPFVMLLLILGVCLPGEGAVPVCHKLKEGERADAVMPELRWAEGEENAGSPWVASPVQGLKVCLQYGRMLVELPDADSRRLVELLERSAGEWKSLEDRLNGQIDDVLFYGAMYVYKGDALYRRYTLTTWGLLWSSPVTHEDFVLSADEPAFRELNARCRKEAEIRGAQTTGACFLCTPETEALLRNWPRAKYAPDFAPSVDIDITRTITLTERDLPFRLDKRIAADWETLSDLPIQIVRYDIQYKDDRFTLYASATAKGNGCLQVPYAARFCAPFTLPAYKGFFIMDAHDDGRVFSPFLAEVLIEDINGDGHADISISCLEVSTEDPTAPAAPYNLHLIYTP